MTNLRFRLLYIHFQCDSFDCTYFHLVVKSTSEAKFLYYNVKASQPVTPKLSGLSIDKNTMKKYTDKTKEVAQRVGGHFVDSTALLNKALDANVGRDGMTLSRDGELA